MYSVSGFASLKSGAFGAVLVLSACASNAVDPVVPEQRMTCLAPIEVYGTRASVKAEGFAESVRLPSIRPAPTMIGYGPSAGYKDELTVIDGVFHIATARRDNQVTLSHAVSQDSGAAFLVTSSPKNWITMPGPERINGLSGLEAQLTAAAQSYGCGGAVAFPFKVTGLVSSANWSMVGRPLGAEGVLANEHVEIVGIYADDTDDIYFIPEGRLIHAHIRSFDSPITAHLNAFDRLTEVSISIGMF